MCLLRRLAPPSRRGGGRVALLVAVVWPTWDIWPLYPVLGGLGWREGRCGAEVLLPPAGRACEHAHKRKTDLWGGLCLFAQDRWAHLCLARLLAKASGG